MINNQYKGIEEVISSKGGQHISIYLKNDKSLFEKTKLLFHQMQKILLSHHDLKTTNKLMKPIHEKLKDKKILSNFSENIAIFKKNGYLRITNNKFSSDDFFVLSNTFHVKPLLTSQQNNNVGTLIFCERGAVKVYSFDSAKAHIISTFDFKSMFAQFNRLTGSNPDSSAFFRSHEILINWIECLFERDKKNLTGPYLIYGDPLLTEFISSAFSSLTGNTILSTNKLETVNLNNALEWSRANVRKFKKLDLEYRVNSFSDLEEDEYVSFNFKEILLGLLTGKVKKLLIAKDQNIFGKIDIYNAAIEFTHFHKDHEDDDLLDDIAQLSIAQGLSPLFVRSSQINGRRPIKAILSKDFLYASKSVARIEAVA